MGSGYYVSAHEACACGIAEVDTRHALLYVEIAHVVVDGLRVVLYRRHFAEVVDQYLAQTGILAVLAPVGRRTVVECLLVQHYLVLAHTAQERGTNLTIANGQAILHPRILYPGMCRREIIPQAQRTDVCRARASVHLVVFGRGQHRHVACRCEDKGGVVVTHSTAAVPVGEIAALLVPVVGARCAVLDEPSRHTGAVLALLEGE